MCEEREKKIYVTLDTEMDADIHWEKKGNPMFTSVLEGIPNVLRPIWNQFNVHPIYFVSPEVAKNEECCKVLKQEVRLGAIIGAHLHPEYIEPYFHNLETIDTAEFPCFAYSKEEEKEKIINLTQLIERNIGVRPIWYRAARYGADIDTMDILQELGYLYDSSVTPSINWEKKGGPNHSAAPLSEYLIADKITEYPITICGKRLGKFGKILPDNWLFYNWLRPTHMTYIEQKKLLKKMKNEQRQVLVMMFHSMEIMINKTPFVRNKWMQRYFLWRLRKTLAYAKKLNYTL